ncbi:hypothetical protein COXBURSA331_0007 (plasmid) [Coxiella burnetii RSA 331]|nr:hypothetical protein COXBURSA331_0007 [Coxiella burnetii RSA 331]
MSIFGSVKKYGMLPPNQNFINIKGMFYYILIPFISIG